MPVAPPSKWNGTPKTLMSVQCMHCTIMAFAYRLSKTFKGMWQSADIVPIKGIVFDMDGTLTEPVLDFTKLRQNLAIPQGVDILQHIDNRPTQSERDEMYSKLLEFEACGASDIRLQRGAKELLCLAAECQVKRALVTRNTQDGIGAFLNKLGDPSSYGGQFTHTFGREFCPPKPDPASIHHICADWGFDSTQVVTVGDTKDDMMAGKQAGTVTVLIENGIVDESARLWSDLHLKSLQDVLVLFQTVFEKSG